jgi:hypothetical protein
MDEHDTTGGTVIWISTWLVGLGVLTMALFPFSLPFLILAAAFALPMLLLLIPVALAAAVGFGLRAVFRRVRPGDEAPSSKERREHAGVEARRVQAH